MIFTSLFLSAIILEAYIFIKSRTTYINDYRPDWMESLLYIATSIIGYSFILFFLDYSVDSFFNSIYYNSSYSDFEIIKKYIHFIGGLKTIFIIILGSLTASMSVTYILTFFGDSFKEERFILIVNIVTYLIVLIVIIFGFSVFSKTVASVLGIIATFLGILVALKTLLKKDKNGR